MYFLAGKWMNFEREKPIFLLLALLTSVLTELLSPTMLDMEGEKSVLVGESCWLESILGGRSLSIELRSAFKVVCVVLTNLGSKVSLPN